MLIKIITITAPDHVPTTNKSQKNRYNSVVTYHRCKCKKNTGYMPGIKQPSAAR